MKESKTKNYWKGGFLLVLAMMLFGLAGASVTQVTDNGINSRVYVPSGDTARLTAALTACSGSSCDIYVDKGTYSLTTSYTLANNTDINLVCAGPEQTTITYTPSSDDILFEAGDNNTISITGCHIKGVSTNANALIGFTTAGINRTVSLYLSNNHIDSFQEYGVHICTDEDYPIGDVMITDNKFTNTPYYNGAAVEVCGKKLVTNTYLVSGNTVFGNLSASGNTLGIHYYAGANGAGNNTWAGDGIIITNNVVKNVTYDGIKVNTARNVIVSNNLVENVGRVGVACIRSHYCSVENNVVRVAGNLSGVSSQGRCYRVQGNYYSHLTDNQGYSCGGNDTQGNGISGGGAYNLIARNTIEASADDAIYLQAAAHDIRIVDNWLMGSNVAIGLGAGTTNITQRNNNVVYSGTDVYPDLVLNGSTNTPLDIYGPAATNMLVKVRSGGAFNDATLQFYKSYTTLGGYIGFEDSINGLRLGTNGGTKIEIPDSGRIDFKGGWVQNIGEVEIDGISAATGQAVCVKSNGDLGTCTDAVNASGGCTCA